MEDTSLIQNLPHDKQDVREIVAYIRNMTRKITLNLNDEVEKKRDEDYLALQAKFHQIGNWPFLEGSIAEARKHQLVGTEKPAMAETPKMLKPFAQFIVRIVMRLSQLFLRSQRSYNLATANILEHLIVVNKEYKNIILAHERRIYEMEKMVLENNHQLHHARDRYAQIQMDVAKELRDIEQLIAARLPETSVHKEMN